MKIPNDLNKFAKIFLNNGFECYLVGGAIRDMLLKRPTNDYDIATNAKPEEVINLFKRVIPTGIKHGTVSVLFNKHTFEVTTYRIENEYSDSRHPDTIEYTSSIFDDLKRRDFTINGIAYDINHKKLLDPHNGISDIKAKIIKTIGNPITRFSEDGLRPLRACRFSSQLNFCVENKTKQAITNAIPFIKKVSKERIRDEFIKILQSDNPINGLELLKDTGLLKVIFPELDACINVKQREMHLFDVYYHSIYSCAGAPQDNLTVRIAALFHDIGKVPALTFTEKNEPRFHGHEKFSAELTKSILERLKFPNIIINNVTHLILNHMFNYEEKWNDSAVRRFISKVGLEKIKDLILLRKSDQIGRTNKKIPDIFISRLLDRIHTITTQENAFSIKDLNINGKALLKHLQIKQGPVIGIILNFLLESVLEDPDLNRTETLLEIATNFYNTRLK